ncbi:uncharacterized protein [Spinacia oleracea]|uniref:Uncharacterized protein n=1 Tax=Spinacia oleracea TaxID=3562 RepID=A0ABM3QZX2_SPIOL|nr:uncharacterized protein LOC130463702 [Spinacia oleracea]
MDSLENVEDLTLLWDFDQSNDDLKMQLYRVTNELAIAKEQRFQQTQINNENIKKLIYLLEIAYKERDEAKDQLRRQMMKLKPHTIMTTTHPNKQEQPNISSIMGQVITDPNTSNPSITLPTQQQQQSGMYNSWNLSPNVNTGITNYSNPTTPSSIMDYPNTSNPSITLPTQQQQHQYAMYNSLNLSPNGNTGITNHSNPTTPSSIMDFPNTSNPTTITLQQQQHVRHNNYLSPKVNTGMTNHSNPTTPSSIMDYPNTSNPSITPPTQQQQQSVVHNSWNFNPNVNTGMTNYSNPTTPSSSMDPYFSIGSSPEFYYSENLNCASSSYEYDPSNTILENLANGRPRPEKGKLLQAVMEAGPLLESLMVAGPVPQWSNPSPPQVARTPQLPPLPSSMSKRPRYSEIFN